MSEKSLADLAEELRRDLSPEDLQEFADIMDEIVASRRDGINAMEEVEKLKARVGRLEACDTEMRRCLKSAYLKLKSRDDLRDRQDNTDVIQDITNTLAFVMQEDSEEDINAWLDASAKAIFEQTAWNPRIVPNEPEESS